MARRFWRVILPADSPMELNPGARTRDGTCSPSTIPTELPTDLKCQIRTGDVTGAPLKIPTESPRDLNSRSVR